MLQRWTLSLDYMHHFFSAHFSEWLLGSSPRELLCELYVCVCLCTFFFFLNIRVCLCADHICMCVCVCADCFTVCAHCVFVCVNTSMCVSVHMLRALACGVWGCVCMHVEWHLAKCGSERRNIWLIIEVPWKKYDHESVLGLRAQP